MHLGGTMMSLGRSSVHWYHEYTGGTMMSLGRSSVHWKDNLSKIGEYRVECGRYDYTGRCSVHQGFHTNLMALSITFPN